jgi:hypothetical protein
VRPVDGEHVLRVVETVTEGLRRDDGVGHLHRVAKVAGRQRAVAAQQRGDRRLHAPEPALLGPHRQHNLGLRIARRDFAPVAG